MDQLKDDEVVENNNNSVHNEPNEKTDNSADISGEKKEEKVIIETRNLENLLKDLREEKRLELFRCCS